MGLLVAKMNIQFFQAEQHCFNWQDEESLCDKLFFSTMGMFLQEDLSSNHCLKSGKGGNLAVSSMFCVNAQQSTVFMCVATSTWPFGNVATSLTLVLLFSAV